MPEVFEIYRQIANAAAARLLVHRSIRPKSDPAKSAHHDWAKEVTPTDLPAGDVGFNQPRKIYPEASQIAHGFELLD